MSRSRVDQITRLLTGLAAILCGGTVLLIGWFLCAGAWPALSGESLVRLFTDSRWQPGSARDPQHGILPMLTASLFVTVLAVAFSAPLGIFGAIWQRFYAPAVLARWHRRLLELLAGVPSVVFGFWGLTVLVPAINRIAPPGQSLLAAAVVLALMILPTIALTTSSALGSLPASQIQAAAALGIGRARLVVCLALPAARGGIGGGILLAAARAVGETLAVVMVCGNVAQFPGSLFDPVRPVTSTIALEMGYASANHKALLFAAALILVLCVGALIGGLAFRRKRSL
jgi:phosphate transport system permease protein